MKRCDRVAARVARGPGGTVTRLAACRRPAPVARMAPAGSTRHGPAGGTPGPVARYQAVARGPMTPVARPGFPSGRVHGHSDPAGEVNHDRARPGGMAAWGLRSVEELREKIRAWVTAAWRRS